MMTIISSLSKVVPFLLWRSHEEPHKRLIMPLNVSSSGASLTKLIPEAAELEAHKVYASPNMSHTSVCDNLPQ